MNRQELRKVAAIHKMAGIGDWPTVAAAAVLTAVFLGGGVAGWAAGKVTEPSKYDLDNLKKEYELARLHRDNQTQQILSAREDAERQMRGNRPKAMRIA